MHLPVDVHRHPWAGDHPDRGQLHDRSLSVSSPTLKLVHNGRVVAGRVKRADSFRDRFFGLMGRRVIDAQFGLLFPGATSIHMFFMRTAIDCLFLAAPDTDGQQRIIDLRRRLRPWVGIVWYVRGARDCLELAPGTIDRSTLKVGDVVRLEPALDAT